MSNDDAYGATIAKRRLARRLSELRISKGYTANQICDLLNWGRGKVGRFEANSWRRPEPSDIRDLARVYGQVDDDLAELESLVALARKRAWWRDYPDVFDNEFPGFENDASTISVIMPLILPGLLQTPAYIEALMTVGSRPDRWRARALEARLRRQQILDRSDGTAPQLVALITEASLMYAWGKQTDRRAQIAHLAEMSRRPNVELRLLRFADGLHPGMSTLLNIFEFPDAGPGMVYLENDAATQEVGNQSDVAAYTQIFGQIRAAALDAEETTAYLDRLKDTLE